MKKFDSVVKYEKFVEKFYDEPVTFWDLREFVRGKNYIILNVLGCKKNDYFENDVVVVDGRFYEICERCEGEAFVELDSDIIVYLMSIM